MFSTHMRTHTHTHTHTHTYTGVLQEYAKINVYREKLQNKRAVSYIQNLNGHSF
jgi:hypothetical protein